MFITERLINLVAPHQCIVCGHVGKVVCDWCLPEIAQGLPSRCFKCRTQTDNSLVCKSCRRGSRLKHVWVRTGYSGQAKQLVYDFKFARKQAAAEPIVNLMTESLPHLASDTIVTHVPTANRRIRGRGYDHAELLAKSLAARIGLEFRPLLRRAGHTRQVGASREERLKQLEGAFQLSDFNKMSGHVLLVDDLVTTGGTLESVAQCLKQAGVQQINAIVFAQKE